MPKKIRTNLILQPAANIFFERHKTSKHNIKTAKIPYSGICIIIPYENNQRKFCAVLKPNLAATMSLFTLKRQHRNGDSNNETDDWFYIILDCHWHGNYVFYE